MTSRTLSGPDVGALLGVREVCLPGSDAASGVDFGSQTYEPPDLVLLGAAV
jgi:hypothetical protein